MGRFTGVTLYFGCAVLAWAQGAEPQGSIAGRVVEAGGKGVAEVTVMVTRTALKPGEPDPGVFTGRTDAEGAYAVTGLAAGDYRVCVSDEAGRYVNPCAWTGAVAVTLGEGEARTGVQATVEEAAEVAIDVADAEERLTSKAGKQPQATLLLGVGAPYIFLPATAGADTAGMKHYTVRVPYEREVELSVVTGTLSVTDEKGATLKRGGDTIRIRVPREQKKKVVGLTVAGVAGGE